MAVEEAMEGHNAIISLSSKSTAILTAIMHEQFCFALRGQKWLYWGGGRIISLGEGQLPPPPRYIDKKGTGTGSFVQM